MKESENEDGPADANGEAQSPKSRKRRQGGRTDNRTIAEKRKPANRKSESSEEQIKQLCNEFVSQLKEADPKAQAEALAIFRLACVCEFPLDLLERAIDERINALYKAAREASPIIKAGYLTRREMKQQLHTASEANGCIREFGKKTVRFIIELGFNQGQDDDLPADFLAMVGDSLPKGRRP